MLAAVVRRPRARLAAAAALAAITAAAVSGCGSGAPQTGTADPASDLASTPAVVWEDWHGTLLPYGTGPDSDGPASRYTAAASGYTRTPHGALLAALHAQVRLGLATDSEWPAVVNTVTAPGPGRDAFAAARTLVSVTGPAAPEAALQWAAYKWAAYTNEQATLTAVVRNPDGTLAAKDLTVVWQEGAGSDGQPAGDWKLLLPASPQPPVALDGLDGYTVFAAGEA